MKTDEMNQILSWMRKTDLVEMSYRRGAEGMELRLEGAHPVSSVPFPAATFVPVSSPGVGVFRFGAPGKPRRAEVDAPVSAGDALGIIETGGKPIEVSAPSSGRLAKILIEDGRAVEYGQPLFLVAP